MTQFNTEVVCPDLLCAGIGNAGKANVGESGSIGNGTDEWSFNTTIMLSKGRGLIGTVSRLRWESHNRSRLNLLSSGK